MNAKKRTQGSPKEAHSATTEEKIKAAARQVFHRKGFAATRTRDIAAEAGINLALLNYYFRGKKKLFDLIMMETVQNFFGSLRSVFYDNDSTLEQKVEMIVDRYIEFLLVKPDIPLFIISELRGNARELQEKLHVKEMIQDSVLLRQYKDAVREGKIAALDWRHFIMNIVSLTIFPFVAAPLVKIVTNINDKEYKNLMMERKRLIPKWIKTMLKTK